MSTSQERLNTALVAWIMELAPWEAFATFTFAGEYSLASTERAWRRFMSYKHRRALEWVAVAEPNPSRCGHHIHAVLHDPRGELQRSELWKAWFDRFGRNKVEAIRDKEDVVSYSTKLACNYLLKGYGWWEVRVGCKMELHVPHIL